jgi:hypothetical protein
VVGPQVSPRRGWRSGTSERPAGRGSHRRAPARAGAGAAPRWPGRALSEPAGRSQRCVRPRRVPSLFFSPPSRREPTCGLPSNDIATSPWQHTRATPWLSLSTRQRPRPPSVERRERVGCYGSSRQADQEQGRGWVGRWRGAATIGKPGCRGPGCPAGAQPVTVGRAAPFSSALPSSEVGRWRGGHGRVCSVGPSRTGLARVPAPCSPVITPGRARWPARHGCPRGSVGRSPASCVAAQP